MRDELAAEMHKVCTQKVPGSLSGRTVKGLSDELYLHYLGYLTPMFEKPGEVANIGGLRQDKPGFDTNGWFFELFGIFRGN